MATKRPVSVQKISNSGSNETSTTQAAAGHATLPSNVNLQSSAPEPSNAAIEGGLEPTTEQKIADSTTPNQQDPRGTPPVKDPEAGPTPVDTSFPERPFSANITDPNLNAPEEPGPDNSLPTRDELQVEFFDEVGMHPVGAGEEGPPTDPQAAREFFAEHGKGSMIAAGDPDIPIEPITVKETEPDVPITPTYTYHVDLEFTEGGSTIWTYPDDTKIIDLPNGASYTIGPDGSITDPDGHTDVPPYAGTRQPPDDEYDVPEEVQGAVDAELARLGQLSGRESLADFKPGSGPDPNETQPVDNDDAAFGAGDVKGSEDVPATLKDRLLGGDDLFGDATPTAGSAGEVHNRNEWAIDHGPDHADPQSSGREDDPFDNPTVETDWSDAGTSETASDTGFNPFPPVVVEQLDDHVPDKVHVDELGG